MKRCGSCGRPYRGRGKIIFVANKRGLKGVRACQECESLTVRILVRLPEKAWRL
jgi:hypothetical protein